MNSESRLRSISVMVSETSLARKNCFETFLWYSLGFPFLQLALGVGNWLVVRDVSFVSMGALLKAGPVDMSILKSWSRDSIKN